MKEERYRCCYKPFLEDGFYLFNYSMKGMEHWPEFICKTFGRKSLLFCVFTSLQLSTVPWRMVIILET